MVWFHCNTVTALNIFKTTGLSAKHFLRRLVNQPKSPPNPNPNPSTFSLSSSSHLAIQQELCQEKLIFQVGKFVSERGGFFNFFLVTVWRQSCDKSTVKLSTTVAFCDMSTVEISTVYLSTVYISTSPNFRPFLTLIGPQKRGLDFY